MLNQWTHSRAASSARQVSRYENGRISPSLEGLVKIAETLDVTVAYLVVETATRRPLHTPANPIETRAADLAALNDDDRAAITNVIDALITKNKLHLITGGAEGQVKASVSRRPLPPKCAEASPPSPR